MCIWISVFLSITCIISGFYVSYHFISSKFNKIKNLSSLIKKSQVIVGIFSVIIGIWAFLKYNIIDDFLPSIASILSGLILANPIFNYINLSDDSTLSKERKEFMQEKLNQYSLAIGLTTFFLGIIHLIDIIMGGSSLFI